MSYLYFLVNLSMFIRTENGWALLSSVHWNVRCDQLGNVFKLECKKKKTSLTCMYIYFLLGYVWHEYTRIIGFLALSARQHSGQRAGLTHRKRTSLDVYILWHKASRFPVYHIELKTFDSSEFRVLEICRRSDVASHNSN